jgi:3-oxoacyl-[acyl-carrier protein] reductase
MDLGIAGKWALVSGASKGLGLGCAQALAHEGVNVVMVARGQEALQAAAAALRAALEQARPNAGAPAQTLAVAADITTPEGRAAAFAAHADYDIVITNAGGPPQGSLRDWDRAAWIKAVDANMLTPIELIRASIDGMAARGFGRIVNITSSAVKAPIDALGLSNGARAGLTGVVAGLARNPETARRGVTINNLLPGKFHTDRHASIMQGAAQRSGKTIEQVRAAMHAQIPAGRFGSPQEFGAVCAFLCSRQAGYLNGQNILLDGGTYPGTF